MAKKKTEVAEPTVATIESQNAPEVEPQVAVEEQVEEAPIAEPTLDAVPETPAEVEVAQEEKPCLAQDFSAIPSQAVDYLKRHPEVDAIYIDKFGGLFSKDTPKVFAKDAVLYNNPYFKQ